MGAGYQAFIWMKGWLDVPTGQDCSTLYLPTPEIIPCMAGIALLFVCLSYSL